MTECTVAAPVRATKAKNCPSEDAQNLKHTLPMRRMDESDEPAAVASSLIVLTLRPNGAKFNGNRIERAQEAGFNWLGNLRVMGYACHDTGDEIARFVVNGGDEAMGQLREIQLHINTANCAIQWRAGTNLVKMVTHYAVLIGGHIADGMGARLDDATLLAVAAHIDAVMEQRLAADRLARTVTLPTGEQRELTELSFAYNVVREAGAKKKSSRGVHFDAPDLHYYEGRALGMQMAGEIVQFYRRHKAQVLRMDVILQEVFERCGNSYGSYERATASNVASGFIDALTTVIAVGARNLNTVWLEHQIAENQRLHEEWCALRAAQKAEFVARMKAARLAKQKGSDA